jgi:predicted acyl esterase
MPKHHRPRKQPTQAEMAQTPLQEELAGWPPTVRAINTLIDEVEGRNKLSHRDAIFALRDYFQWLLAAESDKAMEETRNRVKELEEKLNSEQALTKGEVDELVEKKIVWY